MIKNDKNTSIDDLDYENDEKESFEEEYTGKIDYRIYESTIRELVSWNEDGDMDFEPEYQRGFVWQKNAASRFIESVILGLPIPGIILVKISDSKFEVLDGKQRLISIFSFVSSKPFPGQKEPFKLSLGDENVFNKKSFLNLDENNKKQFLRTKIPVTQIDLEKSSKYFIAQTFERINTGGTKLSRQNIRNAVFKSNTLTNIMKAINSNNDYEKVFSSKEIGEAKDVEIVLRIISLYLLKSRGFNLSEIPNSTKRIVDDLCLMLSKEVVENNIFKDIDSKDVDNLFSHNVIEKIKIILTSEYVWSQSAGKKNILLLEALAVVLFDKNINEIPKLLAKLDNFVIARGEDSNWYNHTNNGVKVHGRIREIENFYGQI